MSQRTDKPTRLLQILAHLIKEGPTSRGDLAKSLECEGRLVLADLHTLEDHGLAATEGENHGKKWFFPLGDRKPRGIFDQVALRLGSEVLGFLDGTAFTEVFDGFKDAEDTAKLGARFDAKLVHLQEPARSYAAQTEVLDTLLHGLLMECVVDVTYRRSNGEVQPRPGLRPLTLVVYRRALYLLALDPYEEVLRLAVDRIVEANYGAKFDYPPDWKPFEELRPYFGIYKRGAPGWVTLRFSAARAELVRSRKWHPEQVLVDLPDGRLELRMRSGGPELVRFVLEWGPYCEAVGPGWLREAVIAELRGALAMYEGGVQEPLGLSLRGRA